MEAEKDQVSYDPLFVRSMIESTLRIGLLFVLLLLSYDIIKPFTLPILWGAIIAIAAFPLVRWLEPKLGGRRGLAATLVTFLFIVMLVVPIWSVMDAIVESIQKVSAGLKDGSLRIPPPNAKVQGWPLIGERLYALWSDAGSNLESFIMNNAEQVREFTGKVLRRIGGSVMTIVIFVVSILIAGGFMAYAEQCSTMARRFFVRVGGLRPGGEWSHLIVATIRNVLQGVVGVAVIQTTLISIGLIVAEVPWAPLWSGIILVVAIAQLPVLIVVAPIIAWMYATADTTTATIFLVYQLLAGASDNILKPMLMGRGLDVPMPIILIGAIGGMIMSGIIGLFAGAVTLSIWYKLFGLWLEQSEQEAGTQPGPGSTSAG